MSKQLLYKVMAEDRAGQEAGGVPDALRLYVKNLGHSPLLTSDDEVKFAQRIEAGVQAAGQLATLQDVLLPPEPKNSDHTRLESALWLGHMARMAHDAITDAEDAKNSFAFANLRLVISIAKRYQGQGVPLLDLIQEGNLGLMRAVEKFDGHKGFKFSTYATWWIRQAVSRGIENTARTIRYPKDVNRLIHAVHKAQKRLIESGVEEEGITLEALAQEAGVSIEEVKEARDYIRISATLSLDAPLDDEDEREFQDLVSDVTEVEEDVLARELPAVLQQAFALSLDARERQILAKRFGLGGEKPMQQPEVGRLFNVSSKRIGQIERRALQKLRQDPKVGPILRDFL